MSVVEQSKAETVARVLERIAEDRYHSDLDEDGEVIIIPDYETTFRERERMFSKQLDALGKMRDISAVQDCDFALGEDWSDFVTLRLLEQEPFNGQDNEWLFPALKGKPYEDVITHLYELIIGELRNAEGLLAAGRETIPKAEDNERSGSLDKTFRDDMHERLPNFHARRLSKQFPKIIDRAERLALLMANYEAPDKVKRYIEEASKSYLYGQWIGCLMVCRSAIQFAVRDRLIASGHRSELKALEDSTYGDSLIKLIELAKKHMAKQYWAALELAHDVRKVANRAVHEIPPHHDECEAMFGVTRTVVQLLYSEPPPSERVADYFLR